MTVRIVRERERRRLSRAKLSRLADVNYTTVTEIELGKRAPYPKAKRQLAEALAWPPERADELFEEVGDGDE